MRLNALKPFIPSGVDYGLAIAFFQRIGFEVLWKTPELCEMRLHDAGFLLQNFSNKELQENLMIRVEVDDLDAFYEHLKAQNIDTEFPMANLGEPQDMPWGERELNVIDPAGVCWHFA